MIKFFCFLSLFSLISCTLEDDDVTTQLLIAVDDKDLNVPFYHFGVFYGGNYLTHLMPEVYLYVGAISSKKDISIRHLSSPNDLLKIDIELSESGFFFRKTLSDGTTDETKNGTAAERITVDISEEIKDFLKERPYIYDQNGHLPIISVPSWRPEIDEPFSNELDGAIDGAAAGLRLRGVDPIKRKRLRIESTPSEAQIMLGDELTEYTTDTTIRVQSRRINELSVIDAGGSRCELKDQNDSVRNSIIMHFEC